MSNKTLRTVLICVICLLVAVLFALASLVLIRANQKPSGTTTPATTTESTSEPTQATLPALAACHRRGKVCSRLSLFSPLFRARAWQCLRLSSSYNVCTRQNIRVSRSLQELEVLPLKGQW